MIIELPIIQNLNLKIGTNYMETELNNKTFKINYCNNVELLIASTINVEIKPTQFIFINVNRQLKQNSLIKDVNTGAHLKHSYKHNTIQISTNNSEKTLFLYPNMVELKLVPYGLCRKTESEEDFRDAWLKLFQK